MFVESVNWIAEPLSHDDIGIIATVIAFADSLVSLAVIPILERKALIRWRYPLWVCLLVLWVALIVCIFGMVTNLTNDSEFVFVVIRITIIAWAIGLVSLMYILLMAMKLEVLIPSKPAVKFKSAKERFIACTKHSRDYFGVKCFNQILKDAADEDKYLYYPILLIADENVRPWEVTQKFAGTGLSLNMGAIYFTFVRPACDIFNQIKRHSPENADFNNLIIVDCYSMVYSKCPAPNAVDNYRVLYVDPRNPHEFNKAYEQGIRILSRKKVWGIRVVYEAFSDFLYLTDRDIAIQYMRHNVVWEEDHGLEAIYVLKRGTIEKEHEEHLIWFSNTTIQMEYIPSEVDNKETLRIKIRGLFREPKEFTSDFNFNLVKTT